MGGQVKRSNGHTPPSLTQGEGRLDLTSLDLTRLDEALQLGRCCRLRLVSSSSGWQLASATPRYVRRGIVDACISRSRGVTLGVGRFPSWVSLSRSARVAAESFSRACRLVALDRT